MAESGEKAVVRRRRRKLRMTPARLSILKFVGEYVEEHGYGPSVREVSEGLDMWIAGVYYHMGRLQGIGRLTCQRDGTGRVIERSWRVVCGKD